MSQFLTANSVSGLIYDKVNDRVLVLCRRRTHMVRQDNPGGLIVELVTGNLDPNLSAWAQFAHHALQMACVALREENITLLNDGEALALSPETSTARCVLVFAVINPLQVDDQGITAQDEEITRLWMPAKRFCTGGNHEDLRVFTMAQFLRAYRQWHWETVDAAM